MTEPIEQAEQEFAKLKWKVGQILMQKFLEYNEGKFHAPLEMNPPIHALTEFVAKKLRQLETQSHDQVRIIEHLEQELVKERELRKELVDGFLKLFQMELHIPSEHWVEWYEYHKQIESLIQKAKDKSHE